MDAAIKDVVIALLGTATAVFGGKHGVDYYNKRKNGKGDADVRVQTVEWCKSVHKALEEKLEERHTENMDWRKGMDEKVSRVDTNVAILLDRSDRDNGIDRK